MKTKLILMLIFSVLQNSGSKRILDIYMHNKSGKMYHEQMRLLATDPRGLAERDIIVREHTGYSVFKITLTGKDGGKKYSTKTLLTLQRLYTIIDAMPMRKEEMAKGGL